MGCENENVKALKQAMQSQNSPPMQYELAVKQALTKMLKEQTEKNTCSDLPKLMGLK